MANYHNQSKLRFWCQMVLPLVYDDSLSYMELLNKVVNYLNNCIQDVGNCETNIESLLEAFVNLQNFVNDIVEDISPIVEEQIEEMIESGAFGDILIDALSSVLAEDYDPTQSYVPLNYVVKDGKIYCCTANTTGSWDSSKWRETTVGNELDTIENILENLNDTITWVTPELYGAIGDGVTDDTTAFISAIASGKIIILGHEKTYLISQTLELSENTQIIGDGTSTVLFADRDTSTSKITAVGENNIRLEGIIFNFGTQTYPASDISISNAKNLRVINCTFLNSFGSVFRISGNSYSWFESCHFENITGTAGNPGECIYGQGFHDVVIHGCTCNHVGDHFLYADGTSNIYNITISDCIFNDTGNNDLTTGAAICLYNYSYNISISNCAFKTHGAGIYIGAHATPLIASHDVTVSGCTFDGGRYGVYISGISESYPAKNIAIIDCNFNGQYYPDNTGGDAIRVIYAKYIIISDFIISDTSLNGISVDNFYDSIISDGLINGVSQVGLLIGSGKGTGAGGNVSVNNIRIYGKQDGTSQYSFYFRRGSGYSIEQIEDDGNFANNAVYPTGYIKATFTTLPWTPTVQGGNIAGSATFENAYYTISGGLVFAKARIRLDSINTDTYLALSGLPFRMYSSGGGITVNANTGKIGNANLQNSPSEGSLLTAYFMSNQAETTAVDQACDVWAVGQIAK